MSSQYLTFRLAETQYAVEVYSVQEVLEYTHITRMPCSEPWMEGLISSRGQGISVVDLRKKFGLESVEPDKDTRIIVMELKAGEDSIITFGAIADSVQEVIGIEDTAIEPAPKFGNVISARFIHGIGKVDGEFIIILNIDQIFSGEELADLAEAEAAAPEEPETQEPEA